MPCNVYSQRYELQNIRNALNVLRKIGYGPLSEPMQRLTQLRNELMAGLGLKKPTVTSLLKLIPGLSPGSVKVFHDSDTGWFTEAREKEGAPPVYHHVSDDVAMTLLKGELTHELEAELMKPDEYIGE